MNRYYVTDLDGTLLRSDGSLSPFAKAALDAAMNDGAMIGFATARSWESARRIVSGIAWNCPVALYNGAVLMDTMTRTVLSARWLDAPTANELLELGRTFGLVPLAFVLDPHDDEKVYHERLTRPGDAAFRAKRPNDPRFEQAERLRLTDADRTVMLAYIGSREELEPLAGEAEARMTGRIHTHLMQDADPDTWMLEFSHPQANKRDGLLAWCRYVGCEPDEVTVFGDQWNDIGLFEAAGRRIAVANADTRLIALADHITSTNDDDGVVRYIAGDLRQQRREGSTPC